VFGEAIEHPLADRESATRSLFCMAIREIISVSLLHIFHCILLGQFYRNLQILAQKTLLFHFSIPTSPIGNAQDRLVPLEL
jgi:hypothetical protein